MFDIFGLKNSDNQNQRNLVCIVLWIFETVWWIADDHCNLHFYRIEYLSFFVRQNNEKYKNTTAVEIKIFIFLLVFQWIFPKTIFLVFICWIIKHFCISKHFNLCLFHYSYPTYELLKFISKKISFKQIFFSIQKLSLEG